MDRRNPFYRRAALVVQVLPHVAIGHNRPIAELLAPMRRDIAGLYVGEFREMAREPVPLERLLDARERLVAALHALLTKEDRAFLLSVRWV